MMMTLKELFRKYLDEKLTPGEFLLFRELATQQENRAELNRLFAQWIDREFPFMQQEEIDVETLYQGLIQKEQIPAWDTPLQKGSLQNAPLQKEYLQKVPAQEEQRSEDQLLIPAVPRIRITRKLILYSAAAAACLLIVSGIFLFRTPAPRPVTPQMAAVDKPVIPASDKAILTLADGTRIVLDNAANGTLARQGNTQVVKLAGGQLVYRAGAGDLQVSGGPNSDAAQIPVDPQTSGASQKPGGQTSRPPSSSNDPQTPGGLQAPVSYNIMATPRGGYFQLVLPDGSKVWLDAASSIRFPTAFNGKERSVELSGEAYFEIAPNARQPFLITSNGMTVQVLGTEFNLMAYQDEDAIRTTLVSGSVKVVRGNDQLQIRPGQQASWARGGNALQLVKPNMEEVLAWKQGEFRFQDLQIPAIMRQIARWYDVDVEFKGPQPKNEFNGVIPRKRSVTDLLAVLEQTDVVHFTLRGRKIIVESVAH
jgi:transmembrane sensor